MGQPVAPDNLPERYRSLQAVSYNTSSGTEDILFTTQAMQILGTLGMVEDIFVVSNLPRWRCRKRTFVLMVQDNEAVASSTSLEERRLPRRTIIIRLFEGEAYFELMGHVRDTEHVVALVDASDTAAGADAVAIGPDGPDLDIPARRSVFLGDPGHGERLVY